MGFIHPQNNYKVKYERDIEKAASFENADDIYENLTFNLQTLIVNLDEDDESINKIMKDVATDILVPGLKRLYQDAIQYLFWNQAACYNDPNLKDYYNYPRHYKDNRDYSDDEDETVVEAITINDEEVSDE